MRGAASFILGVLAFGQAWALEPLGQRMAQRMPVAGAHRGCHAGLAENSVRALERCVYLGVEMAEIDIRLTKDDVPILMHDNELSRTTTAEGSPRKLTYAELSAHRLRDPEGVPTDEPIPSLRQALEASEGMYLLLDVRHRPALPMMLDIVAAGAQERVLLGMRLPPGNPTFELARLMGVKMAVVVRPCSSVMDAMYGCFATLAQGAQAYAYAGVAAYSLPLLNVDFMRVGIGQVKPLLMNVPSLPEWAEGMRYYFPDGERAWRYFLENQVAVIFTEKPMMLQFFLNRTLHGT